MASAEEAVLLVCIMGTLADCEKRKLEEEKKKRKGRVWQRKWIAHRVEDGFCEKLCKELNLVDSKSFRNFLRMSLADFEYLLSLVGPTISRKDTPMRRAISAECRLMLTLRYLATGDSYKSLKYTFRVPQPTITGNVPEVCDTIFNALKCKFMQFPSTPDEWSKIAEQFDQQWNFPNCIGALDGKHIVMVATPNSGSIYYNYKGSHSIVLMALVDANYNFIYIDVGCNGRVSDGGVYGRPTFYQKLMDGDIHLPEDKPLPGREIAVPHLIVADDAFAMNRRLLKPFSQRGLTPRVFNYRLSRARRVVENAFGIMAMRFRVMRKPISLCPDKTSSSGMLCTAQFFT